MSRIDAHVLEQAMHRALARHGLSREHAGYVVDTLVSTSLDGLDTHGVRLFGTYLRELAGGRSRARPNFTVHSALPAIALLDANDALGVVAANEAMRLAIERARTQGVSAVVVRNSNHYGAAGFYANLAARAGQIGFSFSNSDALVAPFNGIQALNGTNPIAMSAPALGDETFSLDMATSQVSYSRVMQYLAGGVPLQPGWVIDAQGRDAATTGVFHSLQPLGGYKGQGLGTMVQILAAVLAGMPFDHTLSHLYGEPWDEPRRVGHCFICIEVSAFGALEAFRQRTSELLDLFRRSASSSDHAVLVAGDREREIRSERLERGIPLDEREWQVLEPWLDLAMHEPY